MTTVSVSRDVLPMSFKSESNVQRTTMHITATLSETLRSEPPADHYLRAGRATSSRTDR